MRTFIIGAAGFVGKYLIDHLRDDREWSVAVSKLPHEQIAMRDVDVFDLDILSREAVIDALHTARADYIFHLAAQSSVTLSWKDPGLTVDTNVKGAVNVLEAIRLLEKKPRVLLIGSGEEYGHVQADEIPIGEDAMLRPSNIYAATKVCQGMLGKIYTDAYGMNIVMARAFNHIGAGQSPAFVVSNFCKQVAEIEAGMREPVIHVGNLSAKRDFTDVRDVVQAYGLLIEKGRFGEFYNVGSGQSVAIGEILEIILAKAAVQINVEVDKTRFRPVDIPVIVADIQKLKQETGWQPQKKLEETIVDILNAWRTALCG